MAIRSYVGWLAYTPTGVVTGVVNAYGPAATMYFGASGGGDGPALITCFTFGRCRNWSTIIAGGPNVQWGPQPRRAFQSMPNHF